MKLRPEGTHMRGSRNDVVAGAIFMVVGLGYGFLTRRTLDVGTLEEMGPGFFPVILCVLLGLLGACTFVAGYLRPQDGPAHPIPWRGMLLLTAAVVTFALTFDRLGIAPSVFLTTVLAAVATPGIGAIRVVLLARVLAVLSALIFGFGLHMPVPILRTGPF